MLTAILKVIVLMTFSVWQMLASSNRIHECGSWTEWTDRCISSGEFDNKICGSILRVRMCTDTDQCWQEYESQPCYMIIPNIFGRTFELCSKRKNIILNERIRPQVSFTLNCTTCASCSTPVYDSATLVGLSHLFPPVQNIAASSSQIVCDIMTEWSSHCVSNFKIKETDLICGSLTRYSRCMQGNTCWRDYELQPCWQTYNTSLFGYEFAWEACSRDHQAIFKEMLHPPSTARVDCKNCNYC